MHNGNPTPTGSRPLAESTGFMLTQYGLLIRRPSYEVLVRPTAREPLSLWSGVRSLGHMLLDFSLVLILLSLQAAAVTGFVMSLQLVR